MPGSARPRSRAGRGCRSARSTAISARSRASCRSRCGATGGRWGVQPGAFLPPLRLTLPEAMAVFLSARLVTRYADKYEPQPRLGLREDRRGLPDALREHVERTLDDLSQRRVDTRSTATWTDLTRAWAERRVVRFRYQPGPLRRDRARAALGRGRAVPAGAVARHPRPVPDRPRPDARGDPHVQGRADRRPVAHPARRSRRPRRSPSRRPSDGRGTSSRTSPRPRSSCASSRRSARARRRGDVAPEPGGPRARRRVARVAGARRGHDRDPAVDPVLGRRGGGARARRAARRRRRHARPRRRALRLRRRR